jgi:hypothetical protein
LLYERVVAGFSTSPRCSTSTHVTVPTFVEKITGIMLDRGDVTSSSLAILRQLPDQRKDP